MEVAAHVRAMELKSSTSNKRKRLDSGDTINQCRLSALNSPDNSASPTTTYGASDQIPEASLCLRNESVETSSRLLDLKADENCGTEEISISVNGGFSNEKTAEEVMETSKTKKNKMSPASSIAAKMPSAAEIEEFFCVAEEYEQKRFVDKYNYDIVRDVPLEGRYQWVCLKP